MVVLPCWNLDCLEDEKAARQCCKACVGFGGDLCLLHYTEYFLNAFPNNSAHTVSQEEGEEEFAGGLCLGMRVFPSACCCETEKATSGTTCFLPEISLRHLYFP